MVEQQKARQMLFDATICIIIHVANGTEATWLKAVSLARPPGGILSRHILAVFVSVFISLSVCLSIRLPSPFHPPFCLSVCPSVSFYPSVPLCLYVYALMAFRLSIHPSLHSPFNGCVCVCVCVCMVCPLS